MPQHVIVDGSNLATEGRTLPSLHQLNDALAAYRADHPDALMTVVVDATFGHRIDPKEVPEFEKAIETNAFVAPPAGAVGRGDGFILSIAQKANASILSNDSYQEFHGEYAWLFDDGRLIGGKPVPHVGWVFVNRVPVRGPISRRSVKEQKVVDKSPGRGRGRKQAADSLPAISANGPMPVPKSPPPGAVLPGQRQQDPSKPTTDAPDRRQPTAATAAADLRNNDTRQQAAARSTNDLLAFLGFVEHFPVGTAVTAVVETYSSHGAYVSIGDAKGYVPLRAMADPAPRSAREVMAIGETVTLVVTSFGPAKRSIDLAVPAMAPPAPPAVAPRTRKSTSRKVAAKQDPIDMAAVQGVTAEAIVAEALQAAADEVTKKAAPARRASTKKAPPPVAERETAEPVAPPAPRKRAKRAAAPSVVAEVPAAEVPAAEVPAAEVPAAEVPAAEVPAADVPAAQAPAPEPPATDSPTERKRGRKAGSGSVPDPAPKRSARGQRQTGASSSNGSPSAGDEVSNRARTRRQPRVAVADAAGSAASGGADPMSIGSGSAGEGNGHDAPAAKKAVGRRRTAKSAGS